MDLPTQEFEPVVTEKVVAPAVSRKPPFEAPKDFPEAMEEVSPR